MIRTDNDCVDHFEGGELMYWIGLGLGRERGYVNGDFNPSSGADRASLNSWRHTHGELGLVGFVEQKSPSLIPR